MEKVFTNPSDMRLIIEGVEVPVLVAKAAPDLLEALEEAYEVLDDLIEPWWIDDPQNGGFNKEKIKKAIKKARGEL